MVDAAGAIYVIGGWGGWSDGTAHDPGNLNDVYASTDGGARPDSVAGKGRRVDQGVLRGYFRSTKEELRGTQGVIRGTRGY